MYSREIEHEEQSNSYTSEPAINRRFARSLESHNPETTACLLQCCPQSAELSRAIDAQS
jgi:hypothetical protein